MTWRKLWHEITRSQRRNAAQASEQIEGTSRQECADRVRILETQILLLRAENRGLLNSVLGIAGVPPIIVDDPPIAFIGRESGEPARYESEASSAVIVPQVTVDSVENNEEHRTNSVRSVNSNAAIPRKEPTQTRTANDPRIIPPMRRRSWHQIYRKLEFESSRKKSWNREFVHIDASSLASDYLRRYFQYSRFEIKTGGNMPFIRGRYHINPAMGEAMEAAREAEAALQALEHIARQKNGDPDDASFDSATPSKGPVRRVEIEAAEMVPSHSGRAQRGYAMRLHRTPPAATEGDDSDFDPQAGTAAARGQSDTHIFSNHHDLLDFLGDELAKDSSN